MRTYNPKANDWHPWKWKGITPEAAKETRQQVRRYLRKTLGDAEGKAEFRRMRGLDPFVREKDKETA